MLSTFITISSRITAFQGHNNGAKELHINNGETFKEHRRILLSDRRVLGICLIARKD